MSSAVGMAIHAGLGLQLQFFGLIGSVDRGIRFALCCGRHTSCGRWSTCRCLELAIDLGACLETTGVSAGLRLGLALN